MTSWQKQQRALEDAQVLLDLADEAHDDASRNEAAQSVRESGREIEKMELARMLGGQTDTALALAKSLLAENGKNA